MWDENIRLWEYFLVSNEKIREEREMKDRPTFITYKQPNFSLNATLEAEGTTMGCSKQSKCTIILEVFCQHQLAEGGESASFITLLSNCGYPLPMTSCHLAVFLCWLSEVKCIDSQKNFQSLNRLNCKSVYPVLSNSLLFDNQTLQIQIICLWSHTNIHSACLCF